MTMFTRNDRPAEPAGKTSTPDKPAAAELRSGQASAQPLSQPAPAASRTAPPQPVGVSVISKALKITGQLESTEDIQIEGEIEGDVRGLSVKVGSNAKVHGTVYGDEVELAGTIDGKIEAKKVVLTGTARMSGDVIHHDITIQSGAFIDGHCRPEFGKTETRSAAHKPAAEKTNGAAARS